MLMSIMFGMATKYSDDLSVNVKRGNREALLSGHWPGYPKIGYQRDPETMMLVRDGARFEAVERIFKGVLAGESPLTIYQRSVHEWNLTTPRHGRQGARPIVRSAFYRLLRDEFYTGTMTRGGVRYPGKHPPAVSLADWQAIQEILDGRVQRCPRPKRLYFPYRGHVFCGTCGSLATARTVVNRWGEKYNYYHCYRKERRYQFCPEPAVSEKNIEDEICRFFEAIWLPDDWLEAVLNLIERHTNNSGGFLEAEREKQAAALERIAKRRDRARNLLIDGVITKNDYERDIENFETKEQKVRLILEKLRSPKDYFQPLVDAGTLVNQALFFFRDGSPEEKSQLVRDITFNLTLTNKTMLVKAKNSFELFLNRGSFPTMRAWLDYVDRQLHIDFHG